MRAEHLDIEHYQMDMPGLIVHAEDDRLVAVDESQRIHEAWFDSRLLKRRPSAGVGRSAVDRGRPGAVGRAYRYTAPVFESTGSGT